MLKLAFRAAVAVAAGFLVAGLLAGYPPARALPAAPAPAGPFAARTVAARPAASRLLADRPAAAHLLAARSAVGRLLAAGSAATTGPTRIRAWGAELMNASTGVRLWSRNRSKPRPMGSITKVMTALVVIARQIVEAMLLPSGCDAALALAKTYGPGRRAFVRRMNATARRLGMLNTHFSNFDGMPLPTDHSTYSTPADLITLGRAAMQLTPFRRIVHQRSHGLAPTAHHHGYWWKNTNLLLRSYPGALGIKTGSTDAAGYCLLFEAAAPDGTTLIGVVLHSSGTDPMTRFRAATRLLNWGFGTSVAPPMRPALPLSD